MSNGAFQPLPPNGRLISAGMAGAAVLGLLMNHYLIESHHVGKLLILCLSPIAFFLGIGGIVEPKIVWSVGKYGKHLPVTYKLIGGALGAMGVAVTMFLLLFVYRLGPPEAKSSTGVPKMVATSAKRTPTPPRVTSLRPESRVAPQEVMYLTYARLSKRWEKMDEAAVQGIRRNDSEGITTLHYTEGQHALLKVLWPDVLEVGDRFTVELQGANSVEMVDLEGADANARTSLPNSDKLVVVEIIREKDKIIFTCDRQSQKPYYASGKLRGDEARTTLLGTELRPGFSVKKGGQASFRNAQIVKP
jgi:hypothetical protein